MHLIEEAVGRRLSNISERARAGSERPLPPAVEAYLKRQPTVERMESAPTGTQERRRCTRRPVNSEVLVRRIGGFNFQVALKDISTAGCRVQMLEPCEVEDIVIARFAHLEPLGSRVCWVDGTTTGLQFQTHVHPAVLDMLVNRLPSSPN